MNSACGKNSDRSLKLPLKTGVLGVCALNGGHQWRNPLKCNYLVVIGSPEPKMVGFCDLVGSAYGPVSKNGAVTRKVKGLDFRHLASGDICTAGSLQITHQLAKQAARLA